MTRQFELVGAYDDCNLGDDLLHITGHTWAEDGTLDRLLDDLDARHKGAFRVYFGGTQFFSFSHRKFRWLLYFMAKAPVVWARGQIRRLKRMRSTALFIGVGPFNNRFAELLTRFELSNCDAILFRDEDSYRWGRQKLKGVSQGFTRDPVFLNHEKLGLCPASGGKGMCFIPRDWPALGGEVERTLLGLARHADGSGRGRVAIFGKDPNSLQLAQRYCPDLAILQYADYGRDRYLTYLDDSLGACDVVVTMRFHGAILALLLGKRVILINIDPKFDQLIQDFGSLVGVVPPAPLSGELLMQQAERLRAIPDYESRVAAITSSLTRMGIGR